MMDNLKNYDPVIYTLKASIETCIERDSKRNPPHEKWAAIAVHNLVSRFDYGTIINNDSSDYKSIVKRIVSEN